MNQLVIDGEKREIVTKGNNLRKSGIVPAVLYSHGKTEHIQVQAKMINKRFSQGVSESTIFTLKIDGQEQPAFIKDFQRHPVSEDIMHVDFFKVTFGEKIRTHINIELQGKPVGVKEGGALETFLHEIDIEAFPKDLQSVISVDISHLKIGEALHVKDLPIPETFKVYTDLNATVCNVSFTASFEAKTTEAEAPAAEAPAAAKGKESDQK